MLSHLYEKLKSNFKNSDDLSTIVECRIFDPLSTLEFYVIACDPENTDSLSVISNSMLGIELETISLDEIKSQLSCEGRFLVLDRDFRKEKALQIWTKLQRKRNRKYGI